MNLIAIAIAAAILAGVTGYKGYNLGIDHQIAKQKLSDDLITKVKDEAMAGSAAAIASIPLRYVPLQGKMQHEIETKIVYRDCKHTDTGVQLINNALTNSSEDSSTDSGKLSKAPKDGG